MPAQRKKAAALRTRKPPNISAASAPAIESLSHIEFRQGSKEPSEVVIGLVGAIGCNRAHVCDTIKQLVKHYAYRYEKIQMSDLIGAHAKVPDSMGDDYLRVKNLISAGNELRLRTKDNSLLSKLAAAQIAKKRKASAKRRTVFVVDSLKHPQEVDELRHIYGSAFYLIAISSSRSQREAYLRRQCHISNKDHRDELINKDQGEAFSHGQGTAEAFHRADFFLNEEGNSEKVWNTLERFFDILFGDPFRTPTFHEYAMYMAYGSSMRSADLSRQVGAVVTKGTDILGTGANECPSPSGGTYWPVYDPTTGLISDVANGRDFKNGCDPNAKGLDEMKAALKKGMPAELGPLLEENIRLAGLSHITEWGRVVHAEMDALLGCARRGLATADATLFCTTFPCHNCAKHIVASGIRKVVYIEPYPKSKAFDLHPDSISGEPAAAHKVHFVPFVGVGPRKFVDFFSLSLGAGARLERKAGDRISCGKWERKSALPRVKALPCSYLDNEQTVIAQAAQALRTIEPVDITS